VLLVGLNLGQPREKNDWEAGFELQLFGGDLSKKHEPFPAASAPLEWREKHQPLGVVLRSEKRADDVVRRLHWEFEMALLPDLPCTSLPLKSP
jgi:hypothetical protein